MVTVRAPDQQIDSAVETILEVLRLYGYTGRGELAPTKAHWKSLCKDCPAGWMKVVKYKLAAFFGFHTGQETLPQKPFSISDRPDFLIGGGAGRWLKRALKGKLSLSLLQSIKQSKKGMTRPGKRELEKTEEEFPIKMTTPPAASTKREHLVTNWNVLNECFSEGTPGARVETELTRETVENQLRRTVDELFSEKEPLTMEERTRAFFPSTSANYINNRKQQGAIGTILEHPTLLEGLRDSGGGFSLKRHTFRTDEDEEIAPEPDTEKRGILETGDLTRRFAQFWWRLLGLATKEEPLVDPVALAEALKIRVITKGPPFRQTAMRAIWKTMHSRLRSHRVFQLIGKPVSRKVLHDTLGAKLGPQQEFISGDYEAATDNLESWVSEAIAERIADRLKLGAPERRLLRESLTGHIFSVNGTPTLQRRGQLMGSITSFPVLCVANAALCRWAMELGEERVIPLSQAALLINGDDCLMKADQKTYKYWQRITSFAGLKESLGKTYRSRSWAEINSTLYEFNPEDPVREHVTIGNRTVERECPYRLVPYVNMGLYKGLQRSGGRVNLRNQANPNSTIGARARGLMEFCPGELRSRVMQGFIKSHREVMEKTRLPWYIPEWLGGLGIPTFHDWNGVWHGPSKLDLRIAHKIIIHWSSRRPISLAGTETNWKTWELAQKKLPQPVGSPVENESTALFRELSNRAAISLLFDSDYKLEDLYKVIEAGKRVSGAIRRNAKLWSPRSEVNQRLPPPLAIQDLPQRRLHDSLWITARTLEVYQYWVYGDPSKGYLD